MQFTLFSLFLLAWGTYRALFCKFNSNYFLIGPTSQKWLFIGYNNDKINKEAMQLPLKKGGVEFAKKASVRSSRRLKQRLKQILEYIWSVQFIIWIKPILKKDIFSGFFYFADRIFIIHLFLTFSFLSYGITYMVNKSYIDKPYNKG